MDGQQQLVERASRPRGGPFGYKPEDQGPKAVVLQGELERHPISPICEFCHSSKNVKLTPGGNECQTCRQGPHCDLQLHPVRYLGAACKTCKAGIGGE